MRKYIAVLIFGAIFSLSSVVSAFSADLPPEYQKEYVLLAQTATVAENEIVFARPDTKEERIPEKAVVPGLYNAPVDTRCNSPGLYILADRY